MLSVFTHSLRCLFYLLLVVPCQGAVWPMPAAGDDLVGVPLTVPARDGETLIEVGRRFDMGYCEMMVTNPHLTPTQPLMLDTAVFIPSQYILPPAPRRGIVVNLAELRLYYYYPDGAAVLTLPIGIGREDWSTPLGDSKVVAKQHRPNWYPTERIRHDSAQMGHHLPSMVPPGPDNPLGEYVLRLNWPTYLIHGTNLVQGVGRRSTAGCLRLFPEDMEILFRLVEKGTPVRVLDLPYKVGRLGQHIYLESHVPLPENKSDLPRLKQRMMQQAFALCDAVALDWRLVQRNAAQQQGLPGIINHPA